MKTLSSVAGGLATKDLVPILSSFCFDGEGYVTTYDDVVTITAPCPELPDFAGALRGSLLRAWLTRQRGDSVKITVDGSAARWTCGKPRLSLPVLDKADFQYQIPDLESGHEIAGDAGLTEAIVEASRSLGLDPSHQWRLGVTLVFHHDAIDVYGSDNATCVRAGISVAVPEELHGRSVVLPPRLVELVRADKGSPMMWVFLDNVVAVEYPCERTVYCRTLGAGKPANHQGPFDAFEWEPGTFFELPPELGALLEGTTSIYSDKADAKASLSFNGARLILEAKTSVGAVYEEIDVSKLSNPGTTDDLSIVVSPSMLRRCLEGAKLIKFTTMGVQLMDDSADTSVLCSVVDGE